jgi:hypothetical protein
MIGQEEWDWTWLCYFAYFLIGLGPVQITPAQRFTSSGEMSSAGGGLVGA